MAPGRRRQAKPQAGLALSLSCAAVLGAGRALLVLGSGRPAARPRAARPQLRAAAAPAVEVARKGSVVEEGDLGGSAPAPSATIFVCTGTTCKSDGSPKCMQMLRELAPEGVDVQETVCLGPCGSGPNVLATPLPEQEVVGGRATEAKRASGAAGSVEQPAGVCFTGMKSPEDTSLLEPWGFSSSDSQGPLGALRLLIRSSQLDQVPWPILLYVGFNGLRVVINLLFHVDLLRLLTDFVKGTH